MSEGRHWLSTRWGVTLAAGFCTLLWGTAYPVIKLGYEAFGISGAEPFSLILFAGMRFFLAGLISMGIMKFRSGRVAAPSRKAWPKALKIGLFQVVVQYVFFSIGTSHTTGVKSAIIGASNVFFTIMIAGLLLHMEKLTWQKWLGCLIGFAGVVLINGVKGMGGAWQFQGEGFLFLGAIGASVATCLVRLYSDGEDPVMLSTWQFVAGGLAMMGIGLAGGGWVHPSGWMAWAMLGYLGCVSAAAYALWCLLMKYNSVSKVTVYTFMTPVFGTLFSMLLLEEAQAFGWTGMGALALVCLGIWLVNVKK
ncbi:MAG: DMT family transporter [Clostridia bacterium]|nr:DMT family transporter [Clostridia bacterium]